MKALTRLQSTIMFQASEHESVATKFSARAKEMVLFGTLVAASLAPSLADAQVMTPSRCATVGATVGGLVGSQAGRTNVSNAVGAALGALGGMAAGNWLCQPKVRSLDSSYTHAANHSRAAAAAPVRVNTIAPAMTEEAHRSVRTASGAKQPLSITERDMLEQLSHSALDAKYGWKKALLAVDQARTRNSSSAFADASANATASRTEFERKRSAFASTVASLHNGGPGVAPRAVDRHLAISGSLLELSTDARVTYQALEQRDALLKQRSWEYREETERASRLRNRG